MVSFIHKFSKNKKMATRLRSALGRMELITVPLCLLTLALSVTKCGIPTRVKRNAVVMPSRWMRKNFTSNMGKLVECVETYQLGCAAGLVALLAPTSHRGLEGIRSRSMQVTASAKDVGSMDSMGHSPAWIQRYSMATPADAGAVCPGFPGPDYVINGFNWCCRKWLARPATTNDRRVC